MTTGPAATGAGDRSATTNTTARWISMTVLTWIAIIYYSIRVHTRRFGSYRHLLVICVLLNLSTQIISIAAIVLAILTDKNNIFSAPEFAFGGDGKTWLHAGSHIFIGIPKSWRVPRRIQQFLHLAFERSAFEGNDHALEL